MGNTAARPVTSVSYGTGEAANAAAIARLFGAAAVPAASLGPGQVQILLGATAGLPAALAARAPGAAATVIPTAGPQGGPVIARDGIPCVN